MRRRLTLVLSLTVLILIVGGWIAYATRWQMAELRVEGMTVPIRTNRYTGRTEMFIPGGDGWVAQPGRAARDSIAQVRQAQATGALYALYVADSIHRAHHPIATWWHDLWHRRAADIDSVFHAGLPAGARN